MSDELAGMADYLVSGYWQSTGSTAHSFDTSAGQPITVDLSALTAAGRSMARWALDAWETVADIDFREVSGSAQIVFSDEGSGAYANANWTVPGGVISGATVNVSTAWLDRYGATPDSYALQTYIHELGHVLGLGHPGPYNDAADYASDAIFPADSWHVSVMSYFPQDESTVDDGITAFAVTPMMADILAVQQIYGAAGAGSATAGDTTYGSNQTIGGYLGQLFDGIAAGGAGLQGNEVALTLYDHDGTDTLDLSGVAGASRISLWSGSFSDVGGAEGVLGIARDTLIENAVGGAGDDTILGNWTDNLLRGGAGGDRLWGSGGSDTLSGEAGDDILGGGGGADRIEAGGGNDTVYGNAGADRIDGGAGANRLWGGGGADLLAAGEGDDALAGNWGNDTLWAGAGNDTLYGNAGQDALHAGDGADLLWGGGGEDSLWGGSGDDRLNGGAGADRLAGEAGDDLLQGGGGADWLEGGDGADTLEGAWGNDTLWGGAAADRFVFGPGGGQDVIGDFSSAQGDLLALAGGLWSGSLSAAEVVAQHAALEGQDVVFDFGAARLTLAGLGSLHGLESDILLV